MMRFHSAVTLRGVAALLSLLSLNCSVFRPIGNVISTGYENTVAYFNSYYNASRIFTNAEREVLDNEKKVRQREGLVDRPIEPPPGAKGMFSSVIDKCSNILTFQPMSALVDDAVFLIGKSYFYQGEFLKAERKFTELLSLDLSRSFALEASLWRLKNLSRLRRDDEVLAGGAEMVRQAVEWGEEDIAAEVWILIGISHLRSGQPLKAIDAHEEAINLSSDETVRGEAQYRIGDAAFEAGEFSRASEAYLKVGRHTDAPALLLPAGLRAIETLRRGGLYGEGLNACRTFLDDYRFQDYRKNIELERARILLAMGKTDEAVDSFVSLDTTHARTEIGAKAAFELGRIHELRGDYKSAQSAYTRASAHPVPGIYNQARERAGAFDRYFRLLQTRAVRDTLLLSMESGRIDSTFGPGARDSLVLLNASNAYEIAEVFYNDLAVQDSARRWYERALADPRDSVLTPRILYLLAELSPRAADSLYNRILDRYPRSPYAQLAAMRLGMEPEVETADPAATVYQGVEQNIESGDYSSAVSGLQSILNEYPSSSYAPKSLFALGWLYEHRLGLPDSALSCYNGVMERYGNSHYAQAVRNRLQPQTREQQARPRDRPRNEIRRPETGQQPAGNIERIE
ncbi:MAG: tetratricopeptide repeat protein [Ignavibacteriales bacterium]|nr:tetratricopeptide repeat protein [Ignavibacteriales bacterium]